MSEVSGATFDIMERMAKDHPALKGAYARSTEGVHIDTVVAVMANEITRLKREIADMTPPASWSDRQ